MKWLFLSLLLISVNIFASEPKFHYGDCVKVKNGFYKNCKGKIDDFRVEDGKNVYYIALICNGEDYVPDVTGFKESEIVKTTGCE